jgi:hypothetical protein
MPSRNPRGEPARPPAPAGTLSHIDRTKVRRLAGTAANLEKKKLKNFLTTVLRYVPINKS